MLTIQVEPETASQSLQPVKMERKAGVALRVTTVPLVYEAEQVAPQVIPPSLEVTVPPPVPALLTVRVKVLSAEPAVIIRVETVVAQQVVAAAVSRLPPPV